MSVNTHIAGTIVSTGQVLAARAYRAACQAAALVRFDKPLISITVVMPGPVKDGPLPRRVLTAALRAVYGLSSTREWPILSREFRWCNTGPEASYVIDAQPELLKIATVELEERHPLGRCWDLNVLAVGRGTVSRKHLGLPERRCLLCERGAAECARARRHPLREFLEVMQRMVRNHDRQFPV